MYRPVLVAAPTTAPITATEVKANSRIDDADSNTLIEGLIAGAISYLDGWSGILCRCLEEQTWRQDYDYFCRHLRIPLAPVISITSVKYDDTSGVEQTVSASNYEVLNDDLGPYVRFVSTFSFPSTDSEYPSVRVTYKAGHAQSGGASTVPPAIRQAMLLLVGHWYEHRESVNVGNIVTSFPMGFDALIAPFRRIRF